MAVNLVFSGSKKSETNEHSLELFVNTYNELALKIESDGIEIISLDKEDAIKLSKELKKQINIISTNEKI